MEKPIVASYCATFLKPEMRHIYRQVTAFQRYETYVITNQRLEENRFPFDNVEVLPKTNQPVWKHLYLKYIEHVPALHYRGEMELILRLLKRRPADLMHVYFGHLGVHLRQFIRYWDRPAVVSFHGADVMPRLQDPHYLGYMQDLFTVVPLVLARSASLAERLVNIGCPREKIRLNRTGIPLMEFPLVERRSPDAGAWRLVQSCRLITKKGLRTALRAFADFLQSYPKATFTIAGEGPLRDELEQLAGQLGIADAVHFAGFLSQAELNKLYSESHLFLHPSQVTENEDQEGIPNSMLEAMATGLPVAGTLHGGIPEAVRDGESGFLVAERDEAALAQVLKRFASSPERTLEMGRTASQGVHEEFDQCHAIAKLEAIYDEALRIGKPVSDQALAHA
jgi:colanic acid/amylovoran biosynthesis glycosyltransferase